MMLSVSQIKGQSIDGTVTSELERISKEATEGLTFQNLPGKLY
jgi:hypothetical protein